MVGEVEDSGGQEVSHVAIGIKEAHYHFVPAWVLAAFLEAKGFVLVGREYPRLEKNSLQAHDPSAYCSATPYREWSQQNVTTPDLNRILTVNRSE